MDTNRMAVLVEGSTFSGRIKGKDLAVLGTFEGTIELSGQMRVGAQAQVKATIKAEAVEVNGVFEGDIDAAVLTFGENARAKGTFRAPRFAIREGAVVDGAVNVSVDKPAVAAEPVIALPPPAEAEPSIKTLAPASPLPM